MLEFHGHSCFLECHHFLSAFKSSLIEMGSKAFGGPQCPYSVLSITCLPCVMNLNAHVVGPLGFCAHSVMKAVSEWAVRNSGHTYRTHLLRMLLCLIRLHLKNTSSKIKLRTTR